jgi:hypothetical protein
MYVTCLLYCCTGATGLKPKLTAETWHKGIKSPLMTQCPYESHVANENKQNKLPRF